MDPHGEGGHRKRLGSDLYHACAHAVCMQMKGGMLLQER